MGDRSRNPDEHQTTTTTLRPPVDSIILTLRVAQNPEDGQVNEVEMKDASSYASSSSGMKDSQREDPVDVGNHNPSACQREATRTSQGGGSSSRQAVDQVIEFNENAEGQQELGHFKLPKSTANTLLEGGGVAQKISDNKNSGKGQLIGCFDVYDDSDDNDDD